MTSQDVFWINAGVGAIFLAIFLIRRGQRSPTKLNLRAGHRSSSKTVGPVRKQGATNYGTLDPETLKAQSLHPKEKTLNVLFIHNGHSWDAFEVLGLPAGASGKMVEDAYQKALRGVTQESREFIDLAYQAIRSRQ